MGDGRGENEALYIHITFYLRITMHCMQINELACKLGMHSITVVNFPKAHSALGLGGKPKCIYKLQQYGCRFHLKKDFLTMMLLNAGLNPCGGF